MPHTNATRRRESVPAIRTRRTRRKAVLTCPTCGHESPVGGDWVARYRQEGLHVRCPVCDTHLTTRNA